MSGTNGRSTVDPPSVRPDQEKKLSRDTLLPDTLSTDTLSTDGSATRHLAERPGGPFVAPVKCPGCARRVDPLRAGHVAYIVDRFRYFCRFECREQYLNAHPDIANKNAITSEVDASVDGFSTLLPPDLPATRSANTFMGFRSELDSSDDSADEEFDPAYLDGAVYGVADAVSEGSTRSDTGAVLLVGATVAGVLSVALALTGTGSIALSIRIGIACVGVLLLVVRAIVTPRHPADPHPVAILGSAAASVCLAIWAHSVGHDIDDEATVLAGLIVVTIGTSLQLVEHGRRSMTTWLSSMQKALDVPARRVVPSGYSVVPSSSLRPGEEIIVDMGETVPVDAVISAGEATVLPWMGAKSATRRGPGQSLVAGAMIVSGRLRATSTWTGFDRSWCCSTIDPHRAAHINAPVARHGRHVVERWGLVGGFAAGMAAFLAGLSAPHVILASIAGHSSLASIATGSAPSVQVLRGVIAALIRGVSYRNADAWERAAQATVAVFSARGTLLLGEPHVAEIESFGGMTSDRVLEVAAGAVTITTDPVSMAVKRAANARGLVADAVRSPTVALGLGVTAVTSAGEALCVGSRTMMLREHISMAAIETRLAELESMGRTVLLVAIAGRIVGSVAMQDGLRAGARAAVQYLLDGGVEPVLMSGDARDTCEAIARSLDIEHVRPEVLPADRAGEVTAMSESGAMVAVVGRLGQDDAMLGAAGVAVAIEAAGASMADWAVSLANDDVREAAGALVEARRARTQARLALAIGLAPSLASDLAIAFGLLPPAYAPLAALIGAVGTHLHLRAVNHLNHGGTVP